MKRLTLTIGMAFLTACGGKETFQGTLKAFSEFQIRGKKETVAVSAGEQNSSFSVNSRGKVEMVIGTQSLQLSLPISAQPSGDGNIEVSAGEWGQSFSVKGRKATSTETGNSYTSSESCILGHEDGGDSCEWVDTPASCDQREECGHNALGQPICKIREVCSGGGRDYVCHHISIPIYGRVEVERTDTTTTTSLDLDFVDAVSNHVVAHFSGAHAETHSSVSRTGYCQ